MPLDVIGAGFGRTSTMSLKNALETLGFVRCYHMFELREHHPHHRPLWSAAHRGEAVDWEALFTGYRASVNWLSCNLWRELAQFYPDANECYDSVMRTIYPSSQGRRTDPDPQARAAGDWVNEGVWEHVFDGRMQDREYAIDVYHRLNASVMESIEPERLLNFDPQPGWTPLCEFLNCSIADAPYPMVNTTREFLACIPAVSKTT
ncbi:MAG: hypothetical protein ACI9DC_001328 [Gammaproteobacteria bacterium]|jgi:hypothetical protein